FPRGAATAQAIGGLLYVAGGGITEPDARADVDEYDPTLDRWRARAPLPSAREHVASCALDGRMIVIGGWRGPERTVVAEVAAYDPALDAWPVLPPLTSARGGL